MDANGRELRAKVAMSPPLPDFPGKMYTVQMSNAMVRPRIRLSNPLRRALPVLGWMLLLCLTVAYLPDLNHRFNPLHGLQEQNSGSTQKGCPFCQFNTQAGSAAAGDHPPFSPFLTVTTIPGIPAGFQRQFPVIRHSLLARPPPSFLG